MIKGLKSLLCTTGILALQSVAVTQSASAQEAPASQESVMETITVTGSLTITDNKNSPTPITAISADQLQLTAPSNISDALLKVPQFADSTSPQSYGSAKINNAGSYVNLRGFGIIRTLILLDGMRVPGTAQNGMVDTNLMPSMFVSRLDIVTGGASAVYGSDAVTGVVNYVLDHKFDGLKFIGQGGISNYGDKKSYKFGIAGGMDLLAGRGHIEGSFEHYDSAGIASEFARPNGRALYAETGAGTAANPFTLSSNTRYLPPNDYPIIQQTGSVTNPFANRLVTANNVFTPSNLGTPTGTSRVYIGGDGGYLSQRTFIAPITTDKAFGRFDYDVTSSISAFAQITVNQSSTENNFFPATFTPQLSNSTPNVLVTNPYLSPANAAILTAAGVTSFNMNGLLNRPPFHSSFSDFTWQATAGLNGTMLGRFNWNMHYTHGYTLEANDVLNLNAGRVVAMLDTITSGGQIVCRVTVTNPTAYPGCVPFNPFVPVAQQNPAAIAWATVPTHYGITNMMDDLAGVIHGDLFDLPAGPLTAALSAEYRHVSYKIRGTVSSTTLIDCTGIAIGCNPANAQFATGSLTNQGANEGIAESAVEFNIPVVKDLPLVESFSVNVAARYAHYSAGFAATTWKVGVDWQMFDDLRFRGTMSRDIRAPSLYELYSPTTISTFGFFDVHTSQTVNGQLLVSGNPALKPEVANTTTMGLVYSPSWLPGLTVSEDYYTIKIGNALATLNGNNATVSNLCETSGGTSPVCSLFVRPLPFSDHSAANIPTAIYSRQLNIARNWTSGFDTEIDYATDLGDLGNLNSRLLVAYQPVNSVFLMPGTPILNYSGVAGSGNPTVANGLARWRVYLGATYTKGSWTVSLTERWRDELKQGPNPTTVYLNGKVATMDYTDVTLQYQISDWLGKSVGRQFEDAVVFLTIENLFNKQPPVFADTLYSNAPGSMYPSVEGENAIGRYWTAGIRFQL